MSLAGDLLRGHTDAIILFRLLKADSYGYEIAKSISALTDGYLELKEATLYSAFRRLENAGQISSYWGEGGGARRRYYTITDVGKQSLRKFKDEWKETRDILDKLIWEKEE